MGLLNKTEGQTDGATDGEAGASTAQQTAEAGASAAAPSAAEVAARALAAHQAGGAVQAASKKVNIYVIKQLKDALPVDFNTLAQVQATQGKFKDKETDKFLGETIEMQLLSWQDNWVVGPNDDKAPKELVKYSNDGKVAKDGTDMLQHLQMLKESGYTKAKLDQRCVVVGALLAAEKDQALVGQLIQIDMSPQSRAQFMRYQANASYNLQVGKLTEDTCVTLKLTAVVAKGGDNKDYTRIAFTAKSLEAAA